MSVAELSVSQMRAAAKAWRRQYITANAMRNASGFLRCFVPELNFNVHDNIDNLIDEIERLRRTSGEAA